MSGLRRGGVLVGVAAVAVAAVWFWSRQPAFPVLKPGIYVGQISGVSPATEQGATFYLEKLAEGDSLLGVVFVEGVRPQSLTPRPLEKKLDTVPVLKALSPVLSPVFSVEGYAPLALNISGQEFTLAGRGESEGASGKVFRGAAGVGAWRLRQVDGESLKEGRLAGSELPFSLEEWLQRKGEFRRARRQLRDQQNELAQKKERIAKLERFLEQESLLRERAQERRAGLAEELKRVVDARKETVKEVTTLVNELSLLGRITNRGRAITLARRVQKRENDWYNANWQADEDTAELEPVFQAHPEIDPGRLEAESKRALETQGFIREIGAEKERIRMLEAKLREGGAGGQASDELPSRRERVGETESGLSPERKPREGSEEPQPEGGSLWDSIF